MLLFELFCYVVLVSKRRHFSLLPAKSILVLVYVVVNGILFKSAPFCLYTER